MKVLITGSTGMVGKNLVDVFSKRQDIHLLTPHRSEVNLLNYHQIKNYLLKAQPEMIIHAAGVVGGIQANIQEPVRFLVENIDINRNVILAASDIGVQSLINLSSSCVYPKDSQTALREEDMFTGKLEPTNEGYAIGKIVSSKLCDYLSYERHELQYKTLIPCNLYGTYDHFDSIKSHLVPAIIVKLHNAKMAGKTSPEVEIWGDGTARREFMFAADLADFISTYLLRLHELPSLLNVGIGFDHSVTEYYEIAANVVGVKPQFKYNPSKPVGMKRKLVSIEKLERLGWRAPTSLHTGLERTYKYFLSLKP